MIREEINIAVRPNFHINRDPMPASASIQSRPFDLCPLDGGGSPRSDLLRLRSRPCNNGGRPHAKLAAAALDPRVPGEAPS